MALVDVPDGMDLPACDAAAGTRPLADVPGRVRAARLELSCARFALAEYWVVTSGLAPGLEAVAVKNPPDGTLR